MRSCRRLVWHLAIPALAITLATPVLNVAAAQAKPDPPVPLAPLSSVPLPNISNIGDFIRDQAAARQLGKALFWDIQVGGDQRQACASCHFSAGADDRVKNQVSPGLKAGDNTFQVTGPNGTLTAGHFPFTPFADIADRDSRRDDLDKNDVASSQGVLNGIYNGIDPATNKDKCISQADPVFKAGGKNTRRVEPRNTPTMINAVFNFRNFWDGRANNNFNGVSPFGQRDEGAKVFRANAGGGVDAVSVSIPRSSLASQAVGPPLSNFEMSCGGRVWQMVGRKLLNTTLIPLGQQKVHRNDSELGLLSRQRLSTPKPGITKSYTQLVQQAFQPQWWSSSALVTMPNGTGGTSEFKQIEANFSLFFGLAVQAYERTLVSDQAKVDKFLIGTGSLTAQEQLGMALFQGQGKCLNCHGGGELTNASVVNVTNERLERMIPGNGVCGVYDNGFYNVGSRPTDDDLGVGDVDPFGNPLSEVELAMLPPNHPQHFSETRLSPPLGEVPECDTRSIVLGAFKTPSLRNVELTGPYFHNGGKSTLKQVVDFYNRGGDFAKDNIKHLDADIGPIGFTEAQKDALVSFLVALTDERVRFQKAPFDHPELCFPNGHLGNGNTILRCVQAVGRAGSAAPIKPFLNLNPFLAEDPVPAALAGP